MKVVIQRVSEASVSVEGNITGKIGHGLMILVGIEESDNESDIEYLTKKIVNLRIFDDSQGVMNISLLDTGGEILLVSQFTLHAQTKKGNRPSYIKAARPETAIPLYEKLKKTLAIASGLEVKSGIFGAEMKVSLVNEGPVTIIIDTKEER
ncbi:MAG: D-aminoacyl-tRNA deacylase [Bacteroidales bacterium]|nr:D-tyrosyl-tRNA(Tyr) deacylase [Bacteroidales bacterium]MDD2280840.1 D-aminoacyl-tRNA deacylase [Bacteroidales bacterium]MDD4293331.1 D-aminoacyl-tRNA deacylase [Bacteroidales bacterium]MDD4492413.1 D-aminoacyl-tRNA deacylase [Bacteroidales bacterium]